MATCLNSTKRAEIEAEIAELQEELDIARATYKAALASGNEQYRLDTGEGSQMTKKRRLSEIKEQIDSLKQEISNLKRQLRCGGLVKLNLRRKIWN